MKIEKIVEFTAVEVRILIEKFLKEKGLVLKKVKFSRNGVVAYVTTVGEIATRDGEIKYQLEKFEDIGCDVKIVNCLKSVGINYITELEGFLQLKISQNKDLKLTPEMVLMGIDSFGEKSVKNLNDFFKLKNLKIKENGSIVPIF